MQVARDHEIHTGFPTSVTKPHFINNIIVSLVALNRKEDRQLLELALLHLGHVFHYVQQETAEVHLQEEFEFVGHYLELQVLRFGKRLSYRLPADKKIFDKTVSRFCLFAIVDEAVEQYVEPSAVPGTVLVGLHRDALRGDRMTVSVRRRSRETRVATCVL